MPYKKICENRRRGSDIMKHFTSEVTRQKNRGKETGDSLTAMKWAFSALYSSLTTFSPPFNNIIVRACVTINFI